MTEEYKFFKDFAGVTDQDLEKFKCGGKKGKVKKMEAGGTLKKKPQNNYKEVRGYDEDTNLRVFNKKDSVVQVTAPNGTKTTHIVKNGKYSKPVPNSVYEKGPNTTSKKKK